MAYGVPFGFLKPAGAGAFVPITDVYTAGNGTRPGGVPNGATSLKVSVYSKGGDGGDKTSGFNPGGGGSSGSYATKTLPVAPGDYGKTITYNTNTGTAATLVGDATAANLTNAALNISCPNGNDGGSSSGGAATSAPTGGTTNTPGAAGQAGGSGLGMGGNCPGPLGGAGGAASSNGIAPGGGGGGGNTNPDADGTHGIGGTPKIILEWT